MLRQVFHCSRRCELDVARYPGLTGAVLFRFLGERAIATLGTGRCFCLAAILCTTIFNGGLGAPNCKNRYAVETAFCGTVESGRSAAGGGSGALACSVWRSDCWNNGDTARKFLLRLSRGVDSGRSPPILQDPLPIESSQIEMAKEKFGKLVVLDYSHEERVGKGIGRGENSKNETNVSL